MPDINELEARCREFIAGKTAADPAHDISHIKRVVNNARQLTEIEESNYLVTLPAAWLHDCYQVAKDSPERAVASQRAADEGCRFLSGIGYPKDLLPAVHHAIEAHSFSANIPVTTTEAGIVQDADRLDALGAIGIARCLLTGGAMGSEIYHTDDPLCRLRTPDDKAYMVDHFYAKLFKLPDTMQTTAGRDEAQRRVEMMQGFLEELEREAGATL